MQLHAWMRQTQAVQTKTRLAAGSISSTMAFTWQLASSGYMPRASGGNLLQRPARGYPVIVNVAAQVAAFDPLARRPHSKRRSR